MSCFFLTEKAHFSGLHAQNDVVKDGEHIHKLEVLMHHADAQVVCVIGVVYAHLFAVFAYFALFRLIKSEKHGHKRGFSRAVLAQKGVYLTPFQLQGDVIVGFDAGKLLGYIEHFNNVRIFPCVCHLLHLAPLSFSPFPRRSHAREKRKFK